MQLLRTNTATRVTVGPIYDTDGLTPKTSLTVTGLKLSMTVDDAGVPTLVLDTAPTASGGANDMVHITGDDAGLYDLELAAANVNYLGRAMLALTDAATHCPVFHEFMILPAMIYDALILGTDRLDTNVTHVGDTAQTAGDIFARLGAPAGASLAVDVAAVKADTAAIRLYPDRTVVRGTVSGTSPSTTSLTPSAFSPAGVAADQFKGRILIFDIATTTTALRGQSTDITASSAAALPVLTYTALTTAPANGDTFSIV